MESVRENDIQKIGDISNNNADSKIETCKYCGKPYKWHEHKIFTGTDRERTMRMQVPTCNCIEENERRKKEATEAQYKKERLNKLFENSLITPYFQKKTFENLKQKAKEYGNEAELKLLFEYSQKFKKGQRSNGIYLLGKPGTGKTSMAAAVCNELLGRGFNCLFITFSALMEKFTKYSYDNNGDILPLLMWLVKFDFIVLDDIGRENYTDRRKEIAYRIIDMILNYEVPAALTANPEMIKRLKGIDDWGAMLDRFKDICAMQIVFKGESLRGRKWL